MEYFSTEQIGRVFVLRLDQGDMLLESIKELIAKEGIKDAVVISAIGTLDMCVLHMVTTTGYPPEEHFERWDNEPLELVSVDGIIADGEPHLHAVISDSEKAYAGHLENGCRILYLGEIVIGELESMDLKRIYNDKHILKLISQREQ